ncbi:penicillin acylase family protein [Natronococcus sp. A-GB1]|uniref:penicillin acylase family protein n=1 Tax=Natronococcus sp. A-GB1 TaxID=3037648 RepID=UPI0024202AF6|nr:penicillin acylase family protein [Natronococcus sp. A-GB1]MDG5761285.1 penicillin acylase family protein [Natronococcus sp. A-GB1]
MVAPLNRRSLLKASAVATAGQFVGSTALAYEEEDGVETAVRIRRDEYGVPHVYARDGRGPEPVFYGYGYATARDRLYQLELYRRYYHGTVAAVLGEEWIEFDREARINHDSAIPLAEQIETQLEDEHRAVLRAYADGINRHIEDVRSGESDRPGFHRGFVEHDFEPEPWDPVDVAGVFVATMAFFSGVNLEGLNAAVLAGLEAEYDEETAWALFEDLQWGDDPDAPTSGDVPNPGFTPPTAAAGIYADRISDGETNDVSNRVTGGEYRLSSDPAGTFERQQERLGTLVDGAHELGIPTTVGSNALVVHGDVTESGDHLLMGGPQMEFSTPSVMYEVGLHGPDFDVAGITVTGYPAIMFGHNGDGSFTSTAGIDKSIQTFVESIRTAEDGPAKYEFGGEWYEMDEDEQCIEVADAEDVTHTVRRTRHGVVTDYDPDAGEAIAQTRAFDGRDMRCFRAFYDAQFADDVESYGEAARQCDYALNFMWAGEGGIGFFHLGRYPDFESVPWDTRLPADGTEHELTDDDFLRAADGEVPYSINPPVGYSAQWNNKPAPDWDNGDRSYSWGVDHRVQRFINLVEHELETTGSVSYDNLKQMVYDTSFVDLRAIRYKPFLLEALDGADLSETESEAKAALEAWDDYGQADGEDYMGTYPPGYTVFDAFFPRLMERTFAPTFGEQFESAMTFLDFRYGRATLMRALYPEETALETAVDYFDGDRDAVFREAFQEAVAELEEEYGLDVDDWRADVAVDDLENVVLFGMPVGVGDAGELPFMNRGTENHFVRIGDEVVCAENVLPPGNSGYVSPDGEPAPHYDDQLDLFLAFEYKELLFEDGEVAAATVDQRVLRPDADGCDRAADPSESASGTD